MTSRRSAIVVAIVAFALASLAAGPRFTTWSTPEMLAQTSTANLEFPGSISKDGLTLYLQRSPLVAIGEDLWFITRDHEDDAWGMQQRLPDGVNSPFNDRAPTISPDGHWLFFGSDRPGGLGDFDIWASWRRHVHDETGWSAPINLGEPINTPALDSGPAFLEGKHGMAQLFFTSGRPGGLGATDIYVSTWNLDGTFTVPELVPELNSSARDERPYVRHDGLEIFLQSNRVGSQLFDVWVATRNSVDDAWSPPENLAAVNSAAQDNTPVVSWDRTLLFLASGRAGNADIHTASRTKIRGRR